MKTYLIIIVLFICSIPFSHAQQYFPKNQLIEDIDSLYISIRELHPDMFTEISQEEFEREMNAIKAELKDSLTVLDFYQIITPLIVKIGDGHTFLFSPFQKMDDPSCRLFPFSVKIDRKDRSLLVKSSYQTEKNIVPEGSTVVTINGKQSSDLVNELLKYESGEKDHFRLSLLENDFAGLLWICYRDTTFMIEYEDPKGILHTTTIAGMDIEQYIQRTNEENADVKSNYSFSIDEDTRIGIVDFQSFSDPDKFTSFIDSVFREIKKERIKDLIIDIRNNRGGNSAIGDEFFQYISPVPYRQFGKMIVNVSQRLKDMVKSRYGEEIDAPIGLNTFDDNKLIELRENEFRFDGNVYLLISNFTFSSATDFSWVFQYFNMGTVIGEETGGLAACFGDVLSQTLPHTGLKYGVSYKKFYCYGATDENTHGTLPDYEVNAEDAMDFALELIKNNRQK